MVTDGTFDEIINHTLFDNLQDEINGTNETILKMQNPGPVHYCNATYVATLPTLNGSYVQSMAYDPVNNWTFVAMANGTLQKYNGVDFSNVVNQTVINIGHANSMCYLGGKLYICYYDSQVVSVVDPVNMTVLKTFSVPINIRGFNVTNKGTIGNIDIITLANQTTSGLNYYCLLPNKKLQYITSSHIPVYGSYRNGLKSIYYKSTNFLTTCYGNDTNEINGQSKGNTIIFTQLLTNVNIIVAVLNSGRELQDLMQINEQTNLFYIINSAGEVYTIQPNFLPVDYNGSTPFYNRSLMIPIQYNLLTLRKDDNNIFEEVNTIENGGSYVNNFYFPNTSYYLEVCYEVNNIRKITKTLATNYGDPGLLRIDISRTYFYNGTKYDIEGYIQYGMETDNTNQNISGDTLTVRKGHLNYANVKVITDNGSTISQQTFNSLDSFINYCTDNSLGFLIGDVKIINIRTYQNGGTPFDAVTWFD